MRLFSDIDLPETAKNVRNFLERDFQHYIQLAGVHRTDLRSPSWSFAPSHTMAGNSAEQKLLTDIDAEAIVKCVVMTIRNCSSEPSRPSQQILSLCYLSEANNWKTAKLLGYESSQYHRLKRIALCEFADRLDYWKTKFGVYELPDLHKFKS